MSTSSPPAEATPQVGSVAAAVQQRFVDALAARAAQRQGRVRAVLEARLQALRSASADQASQAAPALPVLPVLPVLPALPLAAPGPLAELLAHIGDAVSQEARTAADTMAEASVQMPDGATAALELKTLRYFRSTWSRLSADQRLTQSLAQVPPNAGPLHSHHLVHRALTLMRSLSPEYLQHFMAYADALLWLAQVPVADKPAGDSSPARAGAPRKPARAGKPR